MMRKVIVHMEQSRYESIVEIADHYYWGALILLEKENSLKEEGHLASAFKLSTPKVTLASIANEIYP